MKAPTYVAIKYDSSRKAVEIIKASEYLRVVERSMVEDAEKTKTDLYNYEIYVSIHKG